MMWHNVVTAKLRQNSNFLSLDTTLLQGVIQGYDESNFVTKNLTKRVHFVMNS